MFWRSAFIPFIVYSVYGCIAAVPALLFMKGMKVGEVVFEVVFELAFERFPKLSNSYASAGRYL